MTILLVPLVGVLLPLVNAPFELALAFVVLSYFRIPEVFPALIPFHLPELLAVAPLGALAWHLIGTHRMRPHWSPELSLFATLFAFVTFSTALAIDRPIALDYWASTYVKIAVMVPAIAWLASGPREFARAGRAFLLAGLVVGGVALWNKAHGIGLVEGTRVTIGRDIDSVLGDPNDLSLVLLFSMSFGLAFAVTRGIPVFSRLLGALSFLVTLLAIVATQSRGGLLGVGGVLLAIAPPAPRWRLPFLTVGALFVAGLFVVSGIGERSVVLEGGGDLDPSAMGRLSAWTTAVHMALARPLNGVGLGNFVAQYYFFSTEWTGRPYAAHSTWFQVLGEIGVPGFITFVALIGVLAYNIYRAKFLLVGADAATRAMILALMASLAGFVISGSFLSQAFTWPIYIITALGVAVSRYANRFEVVPHRNTADSNGYRDPSVDHDLPPSGRKLVPDRATISAREFYN